MTFYARKSPIIEIMSAYNIHVFFEYSNMFAYYKHIFAQENIEKYKDIFAVRCDMCIVMSDLHILTCLEFRVQSDFCRLHSNLYIIQSDLSRVHLKNVRVQFDLF